MKNKIATANANGRKAVIPYITAGYPNIDRFWYELKEIDASGVDIIEVGVPFSDPVSDGPVIEAASIEALQHGVSLKWLIQGLRERKGLYQAKIVLMGYLNPFLQYGYEQLAKDCAEVGVSGCIIPDVILEESAEIREAFTPHDIALITLVGPNTSLERMQEYAEYTHPNSFVYVVSVLGITGHNSQDIKQVTDTMKRARIAFGDIPLSLGFGLERPEQLNVLPEEGQPNAAVIGTALMQHIESGKPVINFLSPWMK